MAGRRPSSHLMVVLFIIASFAWVTWIATDWLFCPLIFAIIFFVLMPLGVCLGAHCLVRLRYPANTPGARRLYLVEAAALSGVFWSSIMLLILLLFHVIPGGYRPTKEIWSLAGSFNVPPESRDRWIELFAYVRAMTMLPTLAICLAAKLVRGQFAKNPPNIHRAKA